MAFLQNFGVLLDYKHARAVLTKQGTYPAGYNVKSWIKIPFDTRYGITTNAKLNNKKAVLTSVMDKEFNL